MIDTKLPIWKGFTIWDEAITLYPIVSSWSIENCRYKKDLRFGMRQSLYTQLYRHDRYKTADMKRIYDLGWGNHSIPNCIVMIDSKMPIWKGFTIWDEAITPYPIVSSWSIQNCRNEKDLRFGMRQSLHTPYPIAHHDRYKTADTKTIQTCLSFKSWSRQLKVIIIENYHFVL